MTQEKKEKLEKFFASLSLPESQHLIKEDLGLTDEDLYAYQKQKEREVSMKPGKKRDLIVKEVVKPLLKDAGFQCKRIDWWKELEDSWLIIHLKKSQFEGGATGCIFDFLFSVTGKEELEGKLEDQWMYNPTQNLTISFFLPYCGYMSSYISEMGYIIDGYRNYLPLDVPVENIMEQVRVDFEDYVLPEINRIHNKKEWQELQEKLRKRVAEKDVLLLRYYSLAHGSSCSEMNLPHIIDTQKRFGLTKEDILSHFDWLQMLAEKSSHTYLDARPFILKALEMQEQ